MDRVIAPTVGADGTAAHAATAANATNAATASFTRPDAAVRSEVASQPETQPVVNPASQPAYAEPVARPAQGPLLTPPDPLTAAPSPTSALTARGVPTAAPPGGTLPSTTLPSASPSATPQRSWLRSSAARTGVSPLKNPFIAALLIAGGGLVVVGCGLYLNAYFGFDDTGYVTQGQYMAVEAYLRIGPELVMLGIATLIGVGFLLANRWRPSADTDSDSAEAAGGAAAQVWQRGQK